MNRLMLFAATMVMGAVSLSPLARADDFNGPYAGVQAGFGVVKFDGSVLAGPVDDVYNSGTLGGLVGFRSQLTDNSPIVLGIEADLDFYTNGSDWRYGAYGLAGFRTGDKGLLFGRVGYAKLSSGLSDTLDGMVYGAGYEHIIGNMARVRLDYRYLNYGDTTATDNSVAYGGHEGKVAFIVNF